MIQLRNAITDHKREETGLLQQVAERRSRVEAVENENKAISSRNDLVSLKRQLLTRICNKFYFLMVMLARLLSNRVVGQCHVDCLTSQLICHFLL